MVLKCDESVQRTLVCLIFISINVCKCLKKTWFCWRNGVYWHYFYISFTMFAPANIQLWRFAFNHQSVFYGKKCGTQTLARLYKEFYLHNSIFIALTAFTKLKQPGIHSTNKYCIWHSCNAFVCVKSFGINIS